MGNHLRAARAWFDDAGIMDIARARRLSLLLVGVVAFLAVIGRQEGVPKLDTMWAEDGAVFMRCAYFDAWPLSCLAQPYAGYHHLAPRIGALIASAVSPDLLATTIGLLAAMATAAAAVLVARAVTDATDSRLAGFLGGASIPLVYAAGREVLGNLTNLHWILFVAAAVIIVTAWLRVRLSLADVGLVVLAALSSPFAPLLFLLSAPLAAAGRPRGRLVAVLTGAASLLQIGTAAISSRPVAPGPSPRPPGVHWFVEDVVLEGTFGVMRLPPAWSVTAGLVVVIVLLVVATVVRPGQHPSIEDRQYPDPGRGSLLSGSASPIPALAAIGALYAVGVASFAASMLVNRGYNPRYAYAPVTLAVEALVLGASALASMAATRWVAPSITRWPLRRAIVAVLAIVLLVGFGRSFSLQARASDGPAFSDGFQRSAPACLLGVLRLEVDIAPSAAIPWRVTIPCDRVVPKDAQGEVP